MGFFDFLNSVNPFKSAPPPPVYKDLCIADANRPDDLNDLNKNLTKCSSTTDKNRNAEFSQHTVQLESDIESLKAIIGDSFYMGDAIYGKYGMDDITKQVRTRNQELKAKKEAIKNDIYKKEAIIERTDRDFSDVKDSLPETQPKKVLHFIEDYTLAFLTISYFFMVIALNYLFVIESKDPLYPFFNYKAFIQGIITTGFITCFMYMVLYYFS